MRMSSMIQQNLLYEIFFYSAAAHRKILQLRGAMVMTRHLILEIFKWIFSKSHQKKLQIT